MTLSPGGYSSILLGQETIWSKPCETIQPIRSPTYQHAAGNTSESSFSSFQHVWSCVKTAAIATPVIMQIEMHVSTWCFGPLEKWQHYRLKMEYSKKGQIQHALKENVHALVWFLVSFHCYFFEKQSFGMLSSCNFCQLASRPPVLPNKLPPPPPAAKMLPRESDHWSLLFSWTCWNMLIAWTGCW